MFCQCSVTDNGEAMLIGKYSGGGKWILLELWHSVEN